jgi:hypothetical protein
MNKYTIHFVRKCPENGLAIAYRLTIETPHVLMVEAITEEIDNLPEQAYHEAIAQTLTRCLPGRQTLTAHHHGVDIETVRGAA